MNESIRILYQDEHYVAVHKPSGLLVHRSAIAKDDTRFALQLTRERIGQHIYPVHRLDRATSGILILAKSPEAASRLSAIWQSDAVVKRYLAVVRGWTDESGLIDYPLKPRAAFRSNKEKVALKDPQDATTRYERLATTEINTPVGRYNSARYSLLALYPGSGRKHQIRRHLKHIFHPILGDTTYGDGRHNRLIRERFGIERLMLRLDRLSYDDPLTGERIHIDAEADAVFQTLMDAFGWTIESNAASSP